MTRTVWRVLFTALLTLVAGSSTVVAQITTGTATGTIKDPQGGVIPGATVVLVSEARATRSAPAITHERRDFVFPNVTADTYTIEVTMDGFKTLTRRGVSVSGADRVAVPALTLEVGGASETVNVTAEAALVQSSSGERSFAFPPSRLRICRSITGTSRASRLSHGASFRAARQPAVRVSAARDRTTS